MKLLDDLRQSLQHLAPAQAASMHETLDTLSATVASIAAATARLEVRDREVDPPLPLTGAVCSQRRCEGPTYRAWCQKMREPVRYQRKQWEKIFVCQALAERGVLGDGRRGLGFGVGTEVLPSVFAAMGAEVLVTDQEPDQAQQSGWAQSGFEHTTELAALNALGLCEPEPFSRLVRMRSVDMNRIPTDLQGFDFCWSCCALEHLGSIEAGLRFIERSVDCLRPGGVAAHTLEFNLDSNDATVENGPTVLFRRRDIEAVVARLERSGHRVEPIDWSHGDALLDDVVDVPPYHPSCHLRLKLSGYRCTSMGLIVVRGGAASS